MTQPWMKFFGSDWCGDQGLRSCTLAARGLWLEMLLVMDRAEPRGSLLLNSKQIDTRRLASIVGADKRDVEAFFHELDEAGVFSRDADGTVFSRKMRRDEARAERDKANGKGGGNPTLKPKDKPPDKPKPTEGLSGGVNPKDKAQKLEARSQKESSSAQPLVEAARETATAEREKDESLIARCRNLVGIEPCSQASDFHQLERIARENGWTETDILEGIATAMRRGTQRFSAWQSFENWIRNEVKARLARIPRAAQPATLNGHAPAATPDDPIIDLGAVKDIQSKIVNAIQKIHRAGYAGWAETEFGSVEHFRSTVAARAPHLMKFWPADAPGKPALEIAK